MIDREADGSDSLEVGPASAQDVRIIADTLHRVL